MAARIVKSWRGVIRGDLRMAKKYLNSLLSYSSKALTKGVTFLSNQQAVDFLNAVTDINNLLAATKPR